MNSKELREEFVSNENTNFIINSVLEKIYNETGENITYDEKFFSIFNRISSSVFKYESESLSSSCNSISLIVIRELYNYVLKNLKKFENTPVEAESKVILEPSGVLLNSFELNTVRMPFGSTFTETLLENVESIKLLCIDTLNTDYIVTETNNEFIYRERLSSSEEKPLYSNVKKVIIEPGNYTPDQLVQTLERQLGTDWEVRLHELNSKIEIKNNNCNFDILECSILEILGFNQKVLENQMLFLSHFPHKIYKKRYLEMNISINPEKRSLFKERVYLGKNSLTNFKETGVKFNPGILVESVNIDFKDYNHRGSDFDILLEITSRKPVISV